MSKGASEICSGKIIPGSFSGSTSVSGPSNKRAGGERRVETAHPPGGIFFTGKLRCAGAATKNVSFLHFPEPRIAARFHGAAFSGLNRKKDAAENTIRYVVRCADGA